MRWIEIAVATHAEAIEPVSELLTAVAANGVAIEEPYTLEDEGQRWRPVVGAPIMVRAYLPDDEHAAAALRQIEEALWHLKSLGEQFIGALQTRSVDDEDWAETWKNHFYTIRIGEHFVIKPSWRDFPELTPADMVIELDPGMAFGTGMHPTTRLCLELIETVVQPGMQVLDVGTGSGILAIGALKRGATHVLGIDLSAVAVRAARENARMNGLADRFTVVEGTLGIGEDHTPLLIPATPDPGADLVALLEQVRAIQPAQVVVANIIARVIGELAPALLAATAPGGTLITSGIIADRRQEAEEPLRAAGLTEVRVLQEGDWLAIVGRRS